MRISKFIGAVALAAAMLAGTAAIAEPLSTAQVAERTANGQFEFRSRTNLWRFGPDGRVQADYTVSRIAMGGFGEQFGMRASGTWRRDRDRICIEWQQGNPAPNGCYAVLTAKGSMVMLAGPQTLEGTLEPVQPAPPTGLAERPAPRPRPFGR